MADVGGQFVPAEHAHHHVEGVIAERQCGGVTFMQRHGTDPGAGEVAAADGQHFRGDVEAIHSCARGFAGEQAGGVAGAAAQFEHSFRFLVGDELGEPVMGSAGDEPVAGFEQRSSEGEFEPVAAPGAAHVGCRSLAVTGSVDV